MTPRLPPAARIPSPCLSDVYRSRCNCRNQGGDHAAEQVQSQVVLEIFCGGRENENHVHRSFVRSICGAWRARRTSALSGRRRMRLPVRFRAFGERSGRARDVGLPRANRPVRSSRTLVFLYSTI